MGERLEGNWTGMEAREQVGGLMCRGEEEIGEQREREEEGREGVVKEVPYFERRKRRKIY